MCGYAVSLGAHTHTHTHARTHTHTCHAAQLGPRFIVRLRLNRPGFYLCVYVCACVLSHRSCAALCWSGGRQRLGVWLAKYAGECAKSACVCECLRHRPLACGSMHR